MDGCHKPFLPFKAPSDLEMLGFPFAHSSLGLQKSFVISLNKCQKFVKCVLLFFCWRVRDPPRLEKREMSDFKEFSEEMITMLKSDYENAVAELENISKPDADPKAIEAARTIVVDRFARWSAVSAFAFNFKMITEMSKK